MQHTGYTSHIIDNNLKANWKKANEFLAGFWKEIELLEKEGK